MIAVIDGRMPQEAKETLKKYVPDIVELPPYPMLDAPVMSHPDMLLLPLGHDLFFYQNYYGIAKKAIDRIIEQGWNPRPIDIIPQKVYPKDIFLNCFSIHQILFGHKNNHKEYSRLIPEITFAEVKQGYSKCSSIVLKDCVITEDKSIASVCRKNGVECLFISGGHITLPGYNTGFLGGCTGVFGDTVFICGDLMLHPDGLVIKDYLEQKGYKMIALSHGPLFDVGSIFFFVNKNP